MNVKGKITFAALLLIVCGSISAYADIYHYPDRIEINGVPVMVSGSPWTTSQDANGQSLTDLYNLTVDEINGAFFVQEGNGSDIQPTIDKCSGKCVVIIPKGTYDVSLTILPKEDMKLFGTGTHQTILNATNSSMLAMIEPVGDQGGWDKKHRIVLQDFTIEANNKSSGIVMRHCEHCGIYNVNIYNSTGNGLYISSGVDYGFFENIHINTTVSIGLYLDTSDYNRYSDFHIINTGNDGLVVRQADSNVFENFIIHDSGDGITGYGNGIRLLDNSILNTFNNFEIYDNLYEGIRLNSVILNEFSDMTIFSNNAYGAHIKESGYNSISSSIFYNNSGGIRGAGMYSNKIIGNTFKDTRKSHVITLSRDDPYDAEYNIISNNIMWNNPTDLPLEYGIETTSDANYNTFANNVIIGYNTSAIDTNGISYFINNGTISMNEISTNDILSTVLYDTTEQDNILAMNFDNGSINGNDVLDSSTENHHGINNGVIHNSTGGFNGGGAYEFHRNTDENIDINSISIDSSNTLSAWVKLRSCIDGVVFGDDDTASSKFIFWFDAAGTCGRMGFHIDNGSTSTTYSDTIFVTDTWNNIVLVNNGTHGHFYLNGVSDSNWFSSISLGDITIDDLHIGDDSDSGKEFNGTIDEPRIYNRVLSADEILANYRKRTESPNSFVSQKNIKVNTTAIYPQNNIESWNVTPLTNNTYYSGSSTHWWTEVWGNTIYEAGSALSSLYCQLTGCTMTGVLSSNSNITTTDAVVSTEYYGSGNAQGMTGNCADGTALVIVDGLVTSCA